MWRGGVVRERLNAAAQRKGMRCWFAIAYSSLLGTGLSRERWAHFTLVLNSNESVITQFPLRLLAMFLVTNSMVCAAGITGPVRGAAEDRVGSMWGLVRNRGPGPLKLLGCQHCITHVSGGVGSTGACQRKDIRSAPSSCKLLHPPLCISLRIPPSMFRFLHNKSHIYTHSFY